MIEKLAGYFGIHVATLAFVAGLALAAGPAAWGGYKIGHALGYSAGAAAANKEAEINDLSRRLAEAKRDKQAAEQSAAAAREQAAQNARAMISAQEDLDAYRTELEGLAAANNAVDPDEEAKPAPKADVVDLACRRASRLDVDRLRRNHWRPVSDADSPVAPVRK